MYMYYVVLGEDQARKTKWTTALLGHYFLGWIEYMIDDVARSA